MKCKRRRQFAGLWLAVSIILTVSGCGTGISDAVSVFSVPGTGKEETVNKLRNYDSPYTTCYQNADGTYSLYVYASPQQYETGSVYSLIDNSVVKSEKKEFAYENKANKIKTYFPKTLSSNIKIEDGESFLEFRPSVNDSFGDAEFKQYVNMYGDEVQAVVYSGKKVDYVFYPVNTGIKAEIVIKQKLDSRIFDFELKSSGNTFKDDQNSYVLFEKDEKHESIVYKPLLKYKNVSGEQTSFNTEMQCSESKDVYNLRLLLERDIWESSDTKFPLKLDPSFEFYVDKIPDSSAYSDTETNSYLSNYAIVGTESSLGEGWDFLRFRVQWIYQCAPENILSASYNVRTLSSSDDTSTMSLYKVSRQWSSQGMKWGLKPPSAEKISDYSDGSYDLTEFVKECLIDENSETESVGGVQKAENGYRIIATSDNALYSPYMVICFKYLPEYFNRPISINPPTF